MRQLRNVVATVGMAGLAGLAACGQQEKATVDSAAGAVAQTVGTALSVIDVDMGRHVDADRQITDKTDDFAPTDTIFASVHTSGTANSGVIVGRWTFQDGSVVEEKTDTVTTAGDARSAFYIVKPGGLAKGEYTLHVLIDGKEVRTKDVDVK